MLIESGMTTVFVGVPSPPKGGGDSETKAALHRGESACHLLTKLGFNPLCPLLYFPHFLSMTHAPDVADATLLKQRWLEMAEEMWVFGEERDEELNWDIRMAEELGLKVRYCTEPDVLRVQILETLGAG